MTSFDVRSGTKLRTSLGATFFNVRSRTALPTSRELSKEHRVMRLGLLWLAAGAASSVTTGFLGVALGFGEGVFFAFATIAMALAGLAILFVEHITVAREEAEEPEIFFRPSRAAEIKQTASKYADISQARAAETELIRQQPLPDLVRSPQQWIDPRRGSR